ncbi:5-formyltetrahydrofolate cyclo-ligase [Novosphingobium sp. FKTRR1]|uniref:5-formyltetrahydrofolate cyclo-ligase n=1 Tax=Novosphingobium sp. FKTRR1 TaxID=2879118 RepID=UPI001CEFDF28|nr:5-formyltetrahydrofolate cyclo-ligase [Novosphingobium sp. FKTRR1]
MHGGGDAGATLAKARLRKRLRAERQAHVAALDPRIRGLVLRRPPGPILDIIPRDAVIGLYMPTADEAPTLGYAGFFHEAGHTLALPWFAGREAPMEFRRWISPYLRDTLEPDPFGARQPTGGAGPDVLPEVPEVLFVPLVGFSADGGRLGQGGGHYDRWLAAHPQTIAIGLAWDCQLAEELPVEAHDHRLAAVVTPTRLYGPF